VAEPLILGWEEWVALPDLGIPAVKAKIDTGARTSALHASAIEAHGDSAQPMVRFNVNPVPGREDIRIQCSAPVIDRREVASSNGDREMRFVIASQIAIGGRTWPIELTLTNRLSMAYRMLVGRQAIRDDVFVDPDASFVQQRLSHRVYRDYPRGVQPVQHLAIGVLTRQPESATNQRLKRAAEARGHTLEVIDRRLLSLLIDPKMPALLANGRVLPRLDAVIARSGARVTSLIAAQVRQCEVTGAWPINSASALTQLGDRLAMLQTLAKHGLPCPTVAVSPKGLPGGEDSSEHLLATDMPKSRTQRIVRVLVIGSRAVAVIERFAQTGPLGTAEGEGWQAAGEAATRLERQIAERTARAFNLGLASIDLTETRAGPFIAGITATPSLSHFRRFTGKDGAIEVIKLIETSIRPTEPSESEVSALPSKT